MLLELVRLRASLLNGCEFCIGLHRRELAKHHEPESRVGAVAGWRESDAFTERERAALAWTETVTDVQDGHVPDEAFAAAQEHFEEKELVDLTLAIASINAWNRMAIAFRAQWDQGKAAGSPKTVDVGDISISAATSGDGERAAVGDDEGKVSVDGGVIGSSANSGQDLRSGDEATCVGRGALRVRVRWCCGRRG